MRDLTEVEKVPELERTESRLRKILDVDGDKKDLLEPFPDRWSNEEIKTRKIALATMKKIIQRMDRYEDQQVPHIDNLQALCDFVHPILQRSSNGRGYNSMIHVVKPTSQNRDGLPTTCWVLLQQKLDQMNSIVVTPGSGSDIIEEFVKNDYARHNNGRQGTPGSATPRSRGRSGGTPSSTPGGRNTKRARRNLQLDATGSTNSSIPSCSSSGCVSVADSVCLDASCPFHNQIFCLMCFSSNHPLSIRNHERVDLNTDPRGKRVLKQQTQANYCPEFASGPYAILATLMEMSSDRINPEHSLTESRLKKLSQQRCRSNLYDNQAQGGRNAFAAAENLAEKNFLRKEIIPGVRNSEAKFSLLPTGEAMGKLCLAFEKGLKTALYPRSMLRQRSLVLTQPTTDGISTSRQKEIKLIIDSREDAQYINRLTELLSEKQIQYDRRDLPSGDYLFVTQDGDEERVLPMIVERKTWSDLADSVMGRGQRRLDCVRIGSTVGNSCEGNRCQLCRMKRSGCSKRMFIIEGHRCLGRDGEDKCSPSGYCRYCRELLQRHGPEVVQVNLEKNVLERLQCEHGCIIHFTDGFNETISSLLTLHRLLGLLSLNITESNLTYPQFCTNSRSASASSGVAEPIFKKGECVVLAIEEFARRIHEGKGPSSILGRLDASEFVGRAPRRSDDDVIVLDDSDDDTQKNPPAIARSSTKKAPTSQDLIVLDSDSSDEDGDEVETLPRNKDDNDVIVLDDLPPVRRLERPKKKKSSTTNSSTKLVIIEGLLEYDTEYKKDTNTVWKALYKTHECREQNELENVAAQKLKSICDQAEATPLVPREYLQFWSLYFQVFNQNVRIHFPRESEGSKSLRSSWLDRRQRKTSLGSTSSIDSTVNNRQRNPSRRLDFDDIPSTKCMVCELPITKDKLTTKCGHTFHQQCLRAWFDTSKTRKCPQCNVDGIGLPKESESQTRTTSSTSGRKRKNPPGNDGSRPPRVPVSSNSHRPSSELTTDSAIRAARLRRFEGGAATPTPVVSSSSSSSFSSSASSSWDCRVCTLINIGTVNACGACQAPRPGSASSRSSSSFTQHPPSAPYPSYGGAYSTPSSSRQQQPSSSSNSSGSSTGKTRQIRCGACKQVGHNRSSATASNCMAFYDPEEVEMRRKKAEDAQRKARELREETRQREDAMRNQHTIEARRDEELRRLLEENQRKTAEVNRLQAEETKRLEKKAKAAERRARKLRENNN